MKNVLVVGLWHQGIVAAACLADWGYCVTAIDSDFEKITFLREGRSPIYEPYLDELIAKGIAGGRLSFKKVGERLPINSEVILISHDTPVDENDISDLTSVFDSIDYLIPFLVDGVVLHITAQVPVGTCEKIIQIIKDRRPSLTFGLAYSPENLRLGEAINLYRNPMLPVIGTNDRNIFKILEKLYSPANAKWEFTSLATAEMLKHSLNAFLATSVTFANELGNICDRVGADGHRMAQLLKLDPRIGPRAMLKPGLGFSGGTLARDVQTLKNIGSSLGVNTFILDALWQANKRQNGIVVRRLREYFNQSLTGVKICVLGLTYKPETSTLRRSSALEIIDDLVAEGAIVHASDPMADRKEVSTLSGFSFHESPTEALEQVDALVLVTPWNEYKQLDFSLVRNTMVGKFVFDTAGLWNEVDVSEVGLTYVNIGGGKLVGDIK